MILALLLAIFVPSIAFGAACPGSGLAYSCPSGTTPATVQDTITAAADGAVISFDTGAYTWGSTYFTIDNAKGVTLQGAGIGQSIVTVSSPGTVCCSNGHFTGTNTKLYRITGFTFKDAPAGSVVIQWYGATDAWAKNVRVDHNRFQDVGLDTIAIAYGAVGSEVSGLVDHNEFYAAADVFTPLKVLGRASNLAFTTVPQTSTVRGTINNTFFEDNSIDIAVNDNPSIPCIDGWSAGAMVIRFNYIRNCVIASHGSTHRGGVVNMETYGNLMIRDSGSSGGGSSIEEGFRMWMHHGSWESYTWGNRFQHLRTISPYALNIVHYRSADQVEAFGAVVDPPGRCDGTRVMDGNTSPTGTYYGYPCWAQPGRAPANGSPVWGTLAPVYSWNNIDDTTGDTIDTVVADPFVVDVPPNSNTHVVEERDLYNAVSKDAQTTSSSPFDGTTGVGFGTLANRPSTCTHVTSPDGDDGGGVGYFCTNCGSWNQSTSNPQGINVSGADGVLYRCSATNTWTVHYTPYTYPHPLQGASSVEGSGSGLKGGKGLGLF